MQEGVHYADDFLKVEHIGARVHRIMPKVAMASFTLETSRILYENADPNVKKQGTIKLARHPALSRPSC